MYVYWRRGGGGDVQASDEDVRRGGGTFENERVTGPDRTGKEEGHKG